MFRKRRFQNYAALYAPQPAPAGTAPVNTVLPTVSGTAEVGATLTGSDGTYTGSLPMTTAYRWMSAPTSGGTETAISGATSASYTVLIGDVGKFISRDEMKTNAFGNSGWISSSNDIGPIALAAGLAAPTLTWVSLPDDNTPEINLAHDDIAEGDTAVYQFDTVNTFDGPDFFETTNTVDAVEDAAEEITFDLAEVLTDGTWFARARVDRPGHDEGDWSDVVSETIDTAVATPTNFDDTNDFQVVLTNSNRTVTNSVGEFQFGMARSVGVKATGKFYFEWLVDGTPGAENGIGLCNASQPLASGTGINVGPHNVGHNSSNGAIQSNGTTLASTHTGGPLVDGDVVCVAVDVGTKQLWMRRNGGLWNFDAADNPVTPSGGLDISGVTGDLYIFCDVQTVSSTGTLNTGQEAFAFSAPAGFDIWSNEVILDTTAPTISALSPVDGATGVSPTANFTITFSESVVAGADASFRIYETTGDVLVQEYTEADFGGAIVITGPMVSINWPDLAGSTPHYVQITAGSVKDAAGNSFAGISNKTTWNIETSAVSAYTGPGDIMGAAVGWWGLRGFNAAYSTPGTGKAVTLDNGAGSVVDIVILANGTLDAATAAPLIATHKVTKLWDQSGNGRHMTATVGNGLTLSLSGVYHIMIPAGTFAPNSTNFTQAKPFTISAIVNRVTYTTGANAPILWNGNVGSGVQIGPVSTGLSVGITGQASADATYTLNTFAAVQGLCHPTAGSSKLYHDGTLYTGGTTGMPDFSAAPWAGASNAGTDVSKFTETGIWAGDKSASFAALNGNKHAFWSF